MHGLIDNLQAYLHGSRALALLAAYAGGLLVSLTPCVSPVIPITVACIGGRSGGARWRGFALSVAYVLGMSCTYTALGCAADQVIGLDHDEIANRQWADVTTAGRLLRPRLAAARRRWRTSR